MAGLRAFEAAARHLSFTRAAIELNLTQSAISHQIRNLEELIGARFFHRVGNDIRLTEAGIEYLGPARSAITELQVAADRAIGRRQRDVLTIACLGTFAIKCLLPALGDFMRSNPAIRLKVRTLMPYAQVRPDDYDVSIQYGMDADWPGFAAHRITNEEIFPVCSPSLLAGPTALLRPSDLRHHFIIRTTSPLVLRDDWPLWQRKAGVDDLTFAGEIVCDLLYPSYQTAIEGLGVALGRSAVVRNDIAAGRLVEPFSIRMPSPLGYHVVYPQQHANLVKVQRFVDWACGNLATMLK
ncbi:LysR substrate-binding domain-containing protein [Sphingomonas palmae]|nr:LysR substrate-binding domain-containing protein [Sphingomonas palmae]